MVFQVGLTKNWDAWNAKILRWGFDMYGYETNMEESFVLIKMYNPNKSKRVATRVDKENVFNMNPQRCSLNILHVSGITILKTNHQNNCLFASSVTSCTLMDGPRLLGTHGKKTCMYDNVITTTWKTKSMVCFKTSTLLGTSISKFDWYLWTTCFYRLSLLCKVQATCQACHSFLQVQESMATWDGARAQVNVGYLNLKKIGPTWCLYLLIGAVKLSWKNQPFCNQETQNPGPGTVCAASLRPQRVHTHTHTPGHTQQ